jgi:hypothetical protein
MEEMKNAHKILIGNLNGRNHFRGMGVDGRIILKWIMKNRV